MTTENTKAKGVAFRLLTAAALVLIVAAFFAPIWWVSLKAPNYPPEAFPNGVRIHFHMNGVFNGCTLQARTDIVEIEALDCVHEMDAINHFVGMYPIASGGVVEKAFGQFFVAIMAVMLLGFVIGSPNIRMSVMAVGFAVVGGWMYVTIQMPGGIEQQNGGYLDALVTSLGQGLEEEGEPLSPIIAQLKSSLEKSGAAQSVSAEEMQKTLTAVGQTKLSEAISRLHSGSGAAGGGSRSLKEILEEAKESGRTGKDVSVGILKGAFEADQARLPVAEREAWDGSGWQVLYWHYDKSLGRWFNNPDEIGPLVKTMKVAGTIVFWGLLAAMVVLVAGSRKTGGLFYWVLVLAPAIVPVAFIVEYSSWLWWYGHSLNDMGAFTLKPFMPTVLGQGKVAQFSTFSYPHYGFGLFCGSSVLLLLAFLIRRKQLREEGDA